MGGDIKIFYDSTLKQYDIKCANGDICREDGMTTALLMCLFSDRRANDDDVLPKNSTDKKGWWGDQLETNGRKLGSRLWLLSGKTDQASLNLAKEYIEEAIREFVDDGVWQKFIVMTERQGTPSNSILAFQIDAYYANGQKTSYKFKDFWSNEIGLTIS